MTKRAMPTVAQYLDLAIERTGKTQRELAAEIGYPRPNVISMMKNGDTKIPIDKVPAFARALRIDAGYFLRLALAEYHPEIHRVIVETVGGPLSANERAIVDTYRLAAPRDDIAIDGDARARILATLDGLRTRPPGRSRP